ncbi:RdgB/HAM1 family non-canonical purine NTP pyrophosphatase [Wenzhouxiangella sp. AB-CW3]|uniref:RdgB/HAM1 family non-canonical purine NTP pyrophosphatase n=1 Tax=Wenzhouxiangella sp. AB-CW3 TaxID=2771012 RepID=UPI00168AD471|nr:RdgB/HAM1 family non-canonical purine NTP pyrophosphatase [Wenzhouxiangella sp. AB-CW3]QOC22809.1 RdgB/HAM1 family non-canonical purine NTP pyrophosphatase [Wenzhouxiangella sp. AB-CW3]
MRSRAIDRIVLASGNAGKLRELSHLLEPIGVAVSSQADFDVSPPEETGLTFVENALIKAREASRASGLPALADDSGLVVEALDGRPGIHSARFAGDQASDADNNALLLKKLNGLPMERRAAAFHCCLVLLQHDRDPAPIITHGIWQGHILETPRGKDGFGYDPLFYDTELGAAAAELPMGEKSRVSHRGKALKDLINRLKAGSRF